MKKLIALLLLIALSATVYIGCKKGPEDPFLSFKSRKGRMVGTWKLSEYFVDGKDSLTKAKITSTTGVAPCGNIIETINQGLGITMVFGNDGNYSRVFTKDSSYNTAYSTPKGGPQCADGPFPAKNYSVSGRVDSVEKGIWEFAGGVGKYNDKELLVLIESTDDVVGNTFEIVECSSKQLKLKQAITINAVKSMIPPFADSIPGSIHIYEYTFKH